MSNEPQHIVHKLILEVETSSKERGYALKENAAGFVSGSLSPVLEELFEELEKKLNGRVLTLDTLSVNVSAATGDLSHGDIDRLISAAILKEINEQVSLTEDRIPGNTGEKQAQQHVVPAAERQLQSVFHFLKTGTRPWWIPDNASMNRLMEPENLLELAYSDPETLVRELDSDHGQHFVKRLVFQVPETVLFAWFTRAFHFPGALPQTIRKGPAMVLPERVKQRWWATLLDAFREYRRKGSIPSGFITSLLNLPLQQEQDPETIRSFVQDLTGQTISQKPERMAESVTEPEKKREAANTEDRAIYIPVEHAGLILLHPFLKPFLTETGLLEADELTDPELTAHVLHFLATGQENPREYELAFEKFLCGIPFEEPIRQELPIPEAMKEEANNLLAAVVSYWTALRSDSTDLLRLEFLQREAKIILEEFQSIRLVFERKAQDILLEKLPWNLGVVKVDWMKDLLFVEW
jgi:hypothetical protein